MRVQRIAPIAAAISALTAGVFGIAAPAQAASTPASPTPSVSNAVLDVGLPYTFRVTGLSGGSDGVRTPTFQTNSTGKICVDPNLYNEQNATGGASHNNSNFRAEIWKDNTFSDELKATLQFTLSDQAKKCAIGLTTNHGFYVRIKKNVFINGQLMGGTGVVSYS